MYYERSIISKKNYTFMIIASALIGAWVVKLQIMTDRPKDHRPTDGHKES